MTPGVVSPKYRSTQNAEPLERLGVVRDLVDAGDHGRGIRRVEPLARLQVAARVDLRGGIRRPGDEQRLAGREAVVDHGRDVDDRDVGRGELPAELRPVVEDVLRRRVGGVRRGDRRDDRLVGRAVLGIDHARARVRTVDHPVAPGGEQSPHERRRRATRSIRRPPRRGRPPTWARRARRHGRRACTAAPRRRGSDRPAGDRSGWRACRSRSPRAPSRAAPWPRRPR